MAVSKLSQPHHSDTILFAHCAPLISAGVPETAVAMLAKDGERVPFHALFHMMGAVEMWLTRWARRNAMLAHYERQFENLLSITLTAHALVG